MLPGGTAPVEPLPPPPPIPRFEPPAGFIPPVIFPTSIDVYLTTASILLNGENITLLTYNISGRNFFRFRDIAYVLNGTSAQFNVAWDSAIRAVIVTPNQAYEVVGGEMENANAERLTATITAIEILLDDSRLYINAYNIGGNNFVMLRGLEEYLNFNLDWDADTSTILINTD